MWKITTTHRFEKEVMLCEKRGRDMFLLYEAMRVLSETGTLPQSYRLHKLSGDYDGHWEAHLQADWLLIWKKDKDALILVLTATGTHGDLFD